MCEPSTVGLWPLLDPPAARQSGKVFETLKYMQLMSSLTPAISVALSDCSLAPLAGAHVIFAAHARPMRSRRPCLGVCLWSRGAALKTREKATLVFRAYSARSPW